MTYLTRDGAHLVTAWRPDLASLIPHARDLMHEGERFLVFPNTQAEARLARNLGVPIPSPITTRYDWAGAKPWDIQKITAAMLVENTRAYVLSTMGTGKTLAALFALDYLMLTGEIDAALIVAPLSTLTPVWETEIFRYMRHRRAVVLHGDRAKRERLLDSKADFYIINHDGLHVLRHALEVKPIGAIVIDELAVFRNKSTRKWKAAATVAAGRTYVWGMTGSPTPMAPTDAFAQVKLITPNRVPKTFRQFQDTTMRRLSQFKWAPRPGANDIVHRAMQPSVRFTRDDVMELPETIYQDRLVTLDPLAQRAYDMLVHKMRTMTHNGESITAINEGVLTIKLLQVAAGFIYTDTKTVYSLPNAARLDALEEAISETDEKIIVFVPFINAIAGVATHLVNAGHSVATVWGGTPRKERDTIFTQFQARSYPRIIVAHPRCMSHGLTLTASNMIVWYTAESSLEIYEQANARIPRPGQKHKTFIVHLLGTPIERLAYATLKMRGRMQGLLLDLFREQTLLF